MRARLKVRRSFSCLVSRLKIKKYTEKKIAIFDVENCLFGIPYKDKCLKESTRETRGAGQRRMVTSETNLSSKWKMFLENTTNKEELFSLLIKKVRDF